MFKINVEENVQRWHRLTRHLQTNSFDVCLCFINPLNACRTSALEGCTDEVILLRMEAPPEHCNSEPFHAVVRRSCDVADSEIVLSPWLLYNRCGGPRIASDIVVHIEGEAMPRSTTPLAAAEDILFYVLRCSSYSTDVDFSASVRAHFFEHRFYLESSRAEGDVLAVPLCALDQRQHLSSTGCLPSHVLLKVGRVSAPGPLCYIDPAVSRVQLGGVQRDFVPRLAFCALLDADPAVQQQLQQQQGELYDRACRIVTHVLRTWSEPARPPHGLLLLGRKGRGQDLLVARLLRRFALSRTDLRPHEAASAAALRSAFAAVPPSAPCLLLLHDLPRLARSPEAQEVVLQQWTALKAASPGWPVLVCAEAEEEEVVPERVRRVFLDHLSFAAPGRAQREVVLRKMAEQRFLHLPDAALVYLAQRCAGFAPDHLALLLDKLTLLSPPVTLLACDPPLEEIFKLTGRRFRPADIPAVAWEDVGGLEDVIDEVVSAVRLTCGGTGAGGVLLFGPPGTGKTLLAKAVARQCSLNFVSVKGPELLNMYVGQSEANVRDLFRRARDAAPCVVFCDELDSLAPRRGRAGDSAGVMDRVVSQLLAEMEASTESAPLQLIGATNRPDLLDSALLRPGRFDRLVFVGPSRCIATHAAILRAQTRKFPGEFDLQEIAKALPPLLTGADVYAVCSEAWRAAVSRFIAAGEPQEKFCVLQEDFFAAAKCLVPSVSHEELARYDALRERFERNRGDEER